MNLDKLLEKIRVESLREVEVDRQAYEEKKRALKREYELKKASLLKEEKVSRLQEIRAVRNRMICGEEALWNRKFAMIKRAAVDDAIERGLLAFKKSAEYGKLAESLVMRIPKGAKISACMQDAVMQRLLSKKRLSAKSAEFSLGLSYSVGRETNILSIESLLEKNQASVECELGRILFEKK